MAAAEADEPGPGAGRLVDVPPDECWDLLRTRPYGRLVWAGAGGLSVIPVNYLATAGRIVLRTAAYTSAARECRDREVAFQVDDIDDRTRSGWSVLVRGVCRDASPDDGEMPEAWASGSRQMLLAIDTVEVTGRRLSGG